MQRYPTQKSEQYYGSFQKEKSVLMDEEDGGQEGKQAGEGEREGKAIQESEGHHNQRNKRQSKQSRDKNPSKNSRAGPSSRRRSNPKQSDSLIPLPNWLKILAVFLLIVFFLSKNWPVQETDPDKPIPSDSSNVRKQDSMEVIQNQCREGDKVIEIKDYHQRQEPYSLIHEYIPFNQLPICILLSETEHYSLNAIKDSINAQKYANHRIVFLQRPEEKKFFSEEFYQVTERGHTYKAHKNNQGERIEVAEQGFTYNFYQKVITKHCQLKSVIFIVNSPLHSEALININYVHQAFSSYITYSSIGNKYQIFSFYRRTFDLIKLNDFEKTNQVYFSREDPEWLCLSLLELCQQNKRKIKIDSIFTNTTHLSRVHVGMEKCVEPQRMAYQRLKFLSQDYKIDLQQWNLNFKYFIENDEQILGGQFHAQKERQMTQKKGYRAIEYRDLPYLPKGHALAVREQQNYEVVYQVNEFQKTEAFCATVISHNNMENNRYIKVIKSLVEQDYHNYRIIFIDDASSDGTLEATKDYLLSIKFSQDRIKYVRNHDKKGQARNVLNAAFSHCRDYEIQVLIDGKDALLGNQVFKTLNAKYQSNPDLWVVYSASFTDQFMYGASRSIKEKLNFAYGRRKTVRCMGPLMSWRVKLVRNMPLQYHKFKNGEWIDLMYEDALQHAFYELAGTQRIAYIPEIMYLETKEQSEGEAELSAGQIEKIKEALKEISQFPKLPQLFTLSENKNTEERNKLAEIFQGFKNRKVKGGENLDGLDL